MKPKNFNPRDKVLLFNSRVKLFGRGKLRSKWRGPYHVIDTSPHGAITIQDDDGNAYKVNGQRLKVFLDHNKTLDEEIGVIDLVNYALISKKSHIGKKGRWAHSTSQTPDPTC